MLFSAPDLSRRAYLTEWMDEPCSYADLRACLRDLQEVNRLLGGYRPTLAWLSHFAGRERPLHIVDVGCGGGDMLREIERWAAEKRVAVRLTGVDLNEDAIRSARVFTPADSQIEWIHGNAANSPAVGSADAIVSSLLTHHLADEEIVRFLRWMEATAREGWFINDLHRERVPYFAFAALSRLMQWHRFVQHDGPVSIRRAFREEDWLGYLAEADVPKDAVKIEGWRPGRLCVGRLKHA